MPDPNAFDGLTDEERHRKKFGLDDVKVEDVDATTDNYDDVTYVELQSELARRGLNVRGKTDELIARLRENDKEQ